MSAARDLELMGEADELERWRFAGVELDSGRLVAPPGGVFLRLLAGVPVVCFNLTDSDEPRHTWDYIVPFTSVRRMWRRVDDGEHSKKVAA